MEIKISMEDPRKRLFQYHLNADKVEKEYRIWKCLEEQLKQERKKTLKRNLSIEEKRMLFWDSIKKNRVIKKKNPGKKKGNTKNNPKWEERRDKQQKLALTNTIKRNGIVNKQNLKFEQKKIYNNDKASKNIQIEAQNNLNWEKRRDKQQKLALTNSIKRNGIVNKQNLKFEQKKIYNNNKTLNDSQIEAQNNLNWEIRREKNRNNSIERRLWQNSIKLKKQEDWEQRREVLRKNNIKSDEKRKEQHRNALEHRFEERKREKERENALLRRKLELQKEKKNQEKWERKRDNLNFTIL